MADHFTQFSCLLDKVRWGKALKPKPAKRTAPDGAVPAPVSDWIPSGRPGPVLQ